MSALTEAALLREVALVQHDKTLQAVRDAVDAIATTEQDGRSYGHKNRSAAEFKADLVKALKQMREDAR